MIREIILAQPELCRRLLQASASVQTREKEQRFTPDLNNDIDSSGLSKIGTFAAANGIR